MRLATLPRYHLAMLPTPLQRVRNLEAALGPRCPRIYLKRDDLTGLAFGGNKARKLEFLVAGALAQNATVLVTEGAVQSNHARLTAAAAAVAGLKAVLVLDARAGAVVAGNLLLDHLLGADVRIVHDKTARAAAMADLDAELRAAGERPYLIPTGGSVPLGALGYVAMVEELQDQLLAAREAPSRLFFASGSAGTHAGLAVGARAFAAPFRLQAISDGDPRAELASRAARLAAATADLLGFSTVFAASEMDVDDRFVGLGYGIRTEAGLEAIRLLARTEAVFLDPVYTGKAMAGLIDHARRALLGADDTVVFVHTGGLPALFAFKDGLLAALDATP